MSDSTLVKGVATMRFSESPQSLAILRQAYKNGDASVKVLRSFHLRKEQDIMLKELARANAETKVTILRAVIDEWREMKLRETAA